MASKNKRAKTKRGKHWERDGYFLKITFKCKGLCFYNASLRKKINKVNIEED